jgi:hypothetical protein
MIIKRLALPQVLETPPVGQPNRISGSLNILTDLIVTEATPQVRIYTSGIV